MPFVPRAPLVPNRPHWCFHIHQGVVLDDRGCPCHLGWLYKCDVHGSCYLQPNARDPGVPNCRDCPDYDPDD
jgi:hypothetical protein